jgi:4-nitrophenyl phosphatase
MQEIHETSGLIIDMDGVLWRGGKPLPGLVGFFDHLRAREIRFTLATNNATQSASRVRERLEGFGVEVETGEVLTSAGGAAVYLADKVPPGSSVYAIGEAALKEALIDAGFQVSESSQGVAAVVVGMDFSLEYSRLAEAAYALNEGAIFLGTNPDVSFPTERGEAPGNGALLAALEAATGRTPEIYGKPEPHIYVECLHRMDLQAESVVAVGDRLDTDIAGGANAGLQTALLLTGVTGHGDLANSEIQPTWVFEDLVKLTEAFG